MLLKPAEWMSKTNNLNKPQKGTVVDNKDPKKLGRVKVTIDGIYKGNTEDLPWVYPNQPTFQGGSGKGSQFSVPVIGSHLSVTFPHGNVYQPFYSGHWQSEKESTGDFDEDYPESYGWRDTSGNVYRQNKKKGTAEYIHMATEEDEGSSTQSSDEPKLNMKIEKDGSLSLSLKGTINISAEGEINVTSNGEINVTGDKINLN
ncbi:putative baseplate hub subunit and tail lysozyme protein [Rhizobium phage RHph_TM40]|nr:putative baseplate hub subunit and tail lysozyme protein [Rhizobium phage RHph_TM40]